MNAVDHARPPAPGAGPIPWTRSLILLATPCFPRANLGGLGGGGWDVAVPAPHPIFDVEIGAERVIRFIRSRHDVRLVLRIAGADNSYSAEIHTPLHFRRRKLARGSGKWLEPWH